MNISEREYNFLLTVKARREIRALCPDGDITNLDQYLDGPEMEEHVTEVILIMNRAYDDYMSYWEKDYEPFPLTAETVENMTMEDYRRLEKDAFEALRRGMGITVETEEPKAKGRGKKSVQEEKQN